MSFFSLLPFTFIHIQITTVFASLPTFHNFYPYRKLKASGQRLGASTILCHISASDLDNYEDFAVSIANVGHCEAVLCRQGEPLRLSRLFTVLGDPLECDRVRRNDGMITDVSAKQDFTITYF